MCPGQILGVRMALAGCREVDVDAPKTSKKLIVYVEIDRCATDAIQAVTGCKLGKRTLKYLDYGKMAASFLNTETGQAVRILARDGSRDQAWTYGPVGATKKDAQTEAYRKMSENELFVITPVRIQLPEQDRPGHPVSRVACCRCGEGINDRREVKLSDQVLCRACASGAYYYLFGSFPE
ncbi:MAG: FmdE family protein [Dehalococcoidia bacterium]